MMGRAVYVVSRDEGFLIMTPTFLARRVAWSRRYDAIDAAMRRPIHPFMSVAPPWAKRLKFPRHGRGK